MMQTLRVSALLTALALLAPAPLAQEALPIGSEIPMAERVMENANGSATSIAQQVRPRGVAVMFWCNTCPWVRRYEDRVSALVREFSDAGVGFIAVNPNDPVAFPGDNFDAMRALVAEAGYPFAYVVDEGSEMARAFGATRTPQIFLFNSDGRLVYEGTIDDSPSDPGEVEQAFFRDALERMIAGEPIQVEKTKAFGCTIKFQG
jgi:thiol-disulfide isomerase/thioredoxin